MWLINYLYDKCLNVQNFNACLYVTLMLIFSYPTCLLYARVL